MLNAFAALGVGALVGLALGLLLDRSIPWSMFMLAGVAGAFYSALASWHEDQKMRKQADEADQHVET